MENKFYQLTKEIENRKLVVHGIEVFLNGEHTLRHMFNDDVRL